MLSDRTISIASTYWTAHLGIPSGELFAEPFRLLPHGAELADYNGIFALFRHSAVAVSVPPDRLAALRPLLSALPAGCAPDHFARALAPVSSVVMGLAFIGYAESSPGPVHPARALGPEDAGALGALRQACGATDWEAGGSSIEHPCSGVFLEGQLAALAGYEIWGGAIAHIFIVTHPALRQRGFGRSAVAHLTGRALAAGLLPQYRTLIANRASLRLGESLGFQGYATSVAARLRPPACDDPL